jgi:hypothetical protein
MRSGTGTTKLEEVIQGRGKFVREGEAVPVSAFILRSDPYDFKSFWKGTFYISEESARNRDLLMGPGIGSPSFEGKTEVGRHIELPVVYPRVLTQGRLEAEIFEIRYLDSRLNRVPDNQYAHAVLTPTPIALPEVFLPTLHWTGEIKRDRGDRKEPEVSWRTSLGKARFSLHYVFEDTEVGSQRALVRIPSPTISIKIDKRRYNADPKAVLGAVDEQLVDPLSVISFLGRRQVRWVRIHTSARWTEDEIANFDEASWHRRPGVGPQRRNWAPLVNPSRMPPDALGGLIDRYKALPYREALEPAILYLNVAASAEYIEIALVNAFTGLEAVVAALASHEGYGTVLRSTSFRSMSKRLRAAIATMAADEGWDEDTTESLKKKIPELRRRPIVDQVLRTMHVLNVKPSDLWPNGEFGEQAIAAAFGRRNRFIHNGHLGSVDQAHADALRIHVLAERLIFSVLGGDPEWFDFRSFEHLESLGQLETGT